jgi:hypothetical protein
VETHGKHHTPTHKGTVFTGTGMGTKKYTHGLPMSHPTLHVCPCMSIGHGMKNLQEGVQSCDKRLGVAAGVVSVQPAGEPYTPAGHRTLIALRCAKNHRPFNSVLDDDYQAEVEML